jgi:chromosomal replication initiation ATPase DnaA
MIVVCPHCGEVFDYSTAEKKKLSYVFFYNIIDMCCEHFKTTRQKVMSRSRYKTETEARHIAMYLIYGEEKNGIHLHEVGKLFNRDHTTVINARNRCKASLFTKGDVYEHLIILSAEVERIISDNHLKVAI